MGQRIDYYDNIKGLLIILVVFAHCLYGYQDIGAVGLVTDTIYVFHMPAFAFITGFLSKSEHSRSRGSQAVLLSAYLVFNTLMLFYSRLSTGADVSLLTPYYSCWYLLAVFAWRVVSGRIAAHRSAMIWGVVLSLAVGFAGDVTNVLAMGRIIAFYPFFLAGFILPSESIPMKNPNAFRCAAGIFMTAAAVFLASVFVTENSPEDSVMQMFAYKNFLGLFYRAEIFGISALFTAGLCLCAPRGKLPFVTKMGRNSLSVYLLHRILTFPAQRFGFLTDSRQVFCCAVLMTVVICLLTGADRTASFIRRLNALFAEALAGGKETRHHRCRVAAGITAAAVLLCNPVSIITRSVGSRSATVTAAADDIYRQLDSEQCEKFSRDFRLLFAGDLIMLEDQVKRGWDGEKYRFDDMFEYTREYISSADLAAGVFEGPTAGEEAGYSTSNYGDGKPLAVNYPDEFAAAVKNAGFDLVTTASNHLLDKGADGALRTLDVLDEIGTEHIGSYRNAEEKRSAKIIERGGIKFAFLAYTYGANGYSEEKLLSDELSFITSITVDPDSPNAERVKREIAEDFARAQAENPDVVIVLSHMGTQFADFPDEYQKYWYDYFLECGADVILNDHTHSVQPMEITEHSGKTAAIVSCPGNFANIYREHNGDASAMTEIYFDRETKEITGAAVIPMWTQSPINGNYRALPIYDILHDSALGAQLSTYDLERIEQVQRHITKIMLGQEIPCSAAENRYYFTREGYAAQPSEKLVLSQEESSSPIFAKMTAAESVCFVGDSITHGTRNGGFGWYSPLVPYLGSVTQCAAGGATSKTILPAVGTDAELYVVAVGTNDIRYRDEEKCAMNAADYISELNRFVGRIRAENSSAEFIFIAPWTSLDNDSVSRLGTEERKSMNAEYTAELQQWCKKNGHLFSNANAMIDETMRREVQSDYLVDQIHPNRFAGIRLYCRAVLSGTDK